MPKIILKKLYESFISVAPILVIVLILNFTPAVNLSLREIWTFVICAIMLIFGITFFNIGADLAMTPMGHNIGVGLTKSKKTSLLLGVVLIMGILITIAEPDLSVLAGQLAQNINQWTLIISVAIGVGVLLVIAIIKIIFKVQLANILMFFYLVLFAIVGVCLTTVGKDSILALAFDSGGVTTGPITVPFIMALGVGIASIIGGRHSQENSFGLIALCSIGPIVAVLCLGLMTKGTITYTPDPKQYEIAKNIGLQVLNSLGNTAKNISLALGMIVLFFIILQVTILKLPKQRLTKIAMGVVYTFIGLLIFLTAVEVGFLPIGYKIGENLAVCGPYILIGIGFLIGAVVIFAEPAVQVLNKQVEEITSGTVTRKSLLIALTIGVGLAIGLSMLRIYFSFSILYYVVPGYIISLGLSFFVPRIYTAIAFDSGGVASGPLTSSFILPMAIGACMALGHNVLTDAFGLVAMVAMTPLIAIQLLGFKAVITTGVRRRNAMKKIISKDDEQIINF